MLFCVVWWYSIPCSRMDFVLCVLIIPHRILLSQMLLGAVLGAKSSCYSREVFFPSAHLSVQLWSYCEYKFLWVQARAEPCIISNNFYFPVSSCMPRPFQPAFTTVPLSACIIAITVRVAARNAPVWAISSLIGTIARPITVTPEIPRFAGIFLFHNRVCLCGIFLYRQTPHN